MRNIRLIMFSLLLLVFSFGCKSPTGPPPDNTPPGKRDYVWSIDSVDYGNLPSTIQLESIWRSSATDVWGAAGDAPDVRDCLWHYDGTKWSRATEGTPITDNTGNKVVYAVWGTAQNNIWAFGRKINQNVVSAFIMHYDGGQWTDVTPATVAALSINLYNVYGINQNDIWVGGYEYALHYDGTQWRAFKVADSMNIASISGNGKNIYLSTYSPWSNDARFIFFLSGSGFKQIDNTNASTMKFGLFLWARASELTTFANGVISTTLNGDGSVNTTGWQKDFTTSTFLGGIDVQNTKNVFAVGQWNLVCHYNGTDWAQIFIDIPNHAVDPYALFGGVWTDGNEVFICDTQNGIVYHGK